MRMTSHSDYALRVLIYLAMHTDRLVTSEEIAGAYRISKNHLMKVVLGLAHGGFIEAVRGRSGGLKLARTADKIGIGEVIRVMEDDFSIMECMGEQNSCIIAGPCRLNAIMREALSAWFDVLDRFTLADLVKRPGQLKRVLAMAAQQ
ncbi:MAG: Rrf2 family transcriptional regulator [Hyphomicrobiales bacterium]|nr:Rrf2 family transcriptional regulator [Hyphomicrobiales bacterium]